METKEGVNTEEEIIKREKTIEQLCLILRICLTSFDPVIYNANDFVFQADEWRNGDNAEVVF